MTTQDVSELVEALEAFCGLIVHQYTGSREAMSALQVADNLGRAALERCKAAQKAEPCKTVTAWAVIKPDGGVFADTNFINERDAWFGGLGWPGTLEIEYSKQEGYRVEQVTISIPAAKKTGGPK
jgi:hypothetical protein